MKKLVIALLIAPALAIAAPALSAPAAQMVTVKVSGLVCDFCARSVEAMMKKRADVAGVHVDLDKGEVHLSLKEGAALDDGTLTKLITDSGYTVTAIERAKRP
ncbi:heavy-metal-associated domain-containing protein [Sandaracinobacteroides sp. A072]|uniref:heavy-metal-associated domain-containing protein n=1 Tax=Sandaracinobacteroides sp. A072 TaxID=3461146 RepID=UPI0040437A43